LTVLDEAKQEDSTYWPQFLPDGRHVLYSIRAHGTYIASLGVKPEEQGRLQVVQSFPKAGSRKRISTGGAFFPQWRADGKELYYNTPDNTLMAVEVHSDGPEFTAGTPKALFPLKAAPVFSLGFFWQPMRDGQRFLVLDEGPIDVVPEQMEEYLAEIEERMREAARKFDFKQAALYRDRIKELKTRMVTNATLA
jgi:hypothetical protein